MDVLGGVGRVGGRIAQRLGADVVDRLLERGLSVGLGDRLARALAAVAAHQRQRVGFEEVQVRIVEVAATAPRLDQRDRHVGWRGAAADRQRDVVELVAEAELEGQVFLGVAVVVDVDLVQRVRVQREVVRAAVGVLQRQVVGDQRDVVAAPTAAVVADAFVAAEHVEVGAVDLGRGRDERGFAVARCDALAGHAGSCQRNGGHDRFLKFHGNVLQWLIGREAENSKADASTRDDNRRKPFPNYSIRGAMGGGFSFPPTCG